MIEAEPLIVDHTGGAAVVQRKSSHHVINEADRAHLFLVAIIGAHNCGGRRLVDRMLSGGRPNCPTQTQPCGPKIGVVQPAVPLDQPNRWLHGFRSGEQSLADGER